MLEHKFVSGKVLLKCVWHISPNISPFKYLPFGDLLEHCHIQNVNKRNFLFITSSFNDIIVYECTSFFLNDNIIF